MWELCKILRYIIYIAYIPEIFSPSPIARQLTKHVVRTPTHNTRRCHRMNRSMSYVTCVPIFFNVVVVHQSATAGEWVVKSPADSVIFYELTAMCLH
jgi:hypothetical protein